jgi:SAM-dependent methyltransferase
MDHEAYIEMAAAEEAHWWFQGRRQILAAVITRLNLRQDAQILELGSGTGGNFEMLQHFGQLTAVETNELARALSVRKSWGTVKVLAGDLPDGLPQLGKFDLICLFDVLEHVEEDEKTLRVVRQLLAPGGAIVITVPAFAKLWGPHDEQLHHKRRYERPELQAKLQRAGFRISQLSYSNMLLFPLAVAARLGDRLKQVFVKTRKASGTGMLPAPINLAFTAIFAAERMLAGRASLPFGLSLLAVAQADDAAVKGTLDQI